MKDEKLLIDDQKIIIDKIVNHLSSLGSSMYYESTINICREIHEIIKNKSLLNKNENDSVSMLSPDDIQILLSYNSSCC